MDEFYYLRYLKILISVLQGNTLTETSKKLNMTQPAVTKVIQKTEKLLDVKLLDRTTRSAFAVDITAEGKVMLGYLENILACHNEFMHEMEKIKTGDKISILMPPLEMNLYSNIFTNEIPKKLPNIKIAVNTAPSTIIEEVFWENNYDIGIFPSPINNKKELTYSLLKIQDLVAVLYNFDKEVEEIDFDEIKHLPIILQSEGFKIRRIILDLYKKANVKADISKITFFYGAKYGYVNTTFTDKKVSFISEDFITAHGHLQDVKNSIVKIKNNRQIGAFQELFVGYKKDKKLTDTEQKVLDMIRDYIK